MTADTVFFTDLDGTLIHSAKRRQAGDIAVEYKDGTEISCVSAYRAKALGLLKNVVPVTTRSREQYERIRFPGSFRPRYAVIDNGGGMLADGVLDEQWAERAAAVVRRHADELSRCRAILENDAERSFEVRMVDGLFLFTKSRCPQKTAKALGVLHGAEFFAGGGEKVYVIPDGLDKGAGARGVLKLLNRGGFSGKVICAGDTAMDIPLLNIADIAIFPGDMDESLVSCPVKLTAPRGEFCDFVVRKVLEIQGG